MRRRITEPAPSAASNGRIGTLDLEPLPQDPARCATRAVEIRVLQPMLEFRVQRAAAAERRSSSAWLSRCREME